jgi:mxaJ protein
VNRLAALALLSVLGATAARAAAEPALPLTVCADPNNLPFSNNAGEGFENRIVELLARDLGRPVRYVWWAQRRGFARNTLGAAACDLWPGVASGMGRMATTRPYYESTYVFVTRPERDLGGLTLDDARLHALTIGVQMIGENDASTPPGHALARRGIVGNVRGFMVFGNYDEPNPPAKIIDAVASGAVDVALAWGPLAGYFAANASPPLRITPVRPADDDPRWPMHFAISMGVGAQSNVPVAEIDALLTRERDEIRSILRDYGVPLVEAAHP